MIDDFKVVARVDVTRNMLWTTQIERDFIIFEKGKIYTCEKPSDFGFYTVFYGNGITHESGGWFFDLPYEDFTKDIFHTFFKLLIEDRNEKIENILYK